MRFPFALVALLLPLCAVAASAARPATKVQRTERGSLVTENVPEIPAALAELSNQYQQARGASLQGWAGHSILIT
ncbi:MAG: S9 family peptidase, partial [Gammaproteobacteria bacterium]